MRPFHNAIIIDKKRSNTCEEVEKREEKDWGGVKVEPEQLGNGAKSLRQMARGAGRILHPIMKTPQSTNLQLRAAPSVPPAATERQQPANKHPLMNGKAPFGGTGNVDVSGMHYTLRLHYQAVTVSFCVIRALDRFRG